MTHHFKLSMTCLTLFLIVLGCKNRPASETVDIAKALSEGDTACYARAKGPIGLKFPKDFGPHEDFKTEWWYYTGNLKDQTGRHFGFQLTFFRQALACEKPAGGSKWRTRQLFFAHFAVTDTQNKRFFSARRMNRGSLGIAGAVPSPFRVWLDNWEAAGTGNKKIVLKARDHDGGNAGLFGLNLTLVRTKPMILQGRDGWSKKGPGPSDASYYYSFPGMGAQGNITLGKDIYKVTGRAWFDHEWSTSALSDQTAGWDWLSLHLDKGPKKGTDIMVCVIRKKDGTSNGFGFGSVSFPDGRVEILNNGQFFLTPEAFWRSPATGITYPAQWTITLPGPDIRLNVKPMIPDQEHKAGFTYYEGAVMAKGADNLTSGMGYVEMTGY